MPTRLPLVLAVAALAVCAALPQLAAAAPLVPQPLVDRTPAGMPFVAFCPLDLGAADAVAWFTRRTDGEGRSIEQVQAASVGPIAAGQSASSAASLERAAGAAGCPVAAVSPDGAALLAYMEGDNDREPAQVIVAERPAGGSLGLALPLPGAIGTQVAVARAPGGAAAVAWIASEVVDTVGGARRVVRFRPLVALRDAGGQFGPPIPLGELAESNSADGHPPRVGIDAAGNAIVAWTRPAQAPGSETDDELWVARRPAGGALGPPERIDVADRIDAQLAVASTGEALLLTQGNTGLRVASGSARDGFVAMTPLAGLNAGDPSVTIADGGAAAIGWIGTVDGGETGTSGAVVATRPSAASGFTARLLSSRASRTSIEELRVALAADGRTLATWQGLHRAPDGGLEWAPFAALGNASGAWDRPRRVTHGCRYADRPQPAFGRDGSPRVSLLHSSLADGGDYSAPIRPRLRTVAFGTSRSADRTPPRLRLSAPRAQRLPRWKRDSERGVRVRVRCSQDCDVSLFAEVLRSGEDASDTSGLFPALPRLRAGVLRAFTLHETDALYWAPGEPLEPGDRVPVRVTARACDAAGNSTRATARVLLTLPDR